MEYTVKELIEELKIERDKQVNIADQVEAEQDLISMHKAYGNISDIDIALRVINQYYNIS